MLNYCAKGVPSGVAGSCREWHAAFVVCKFSWRFLAFSQNVGGVGQHILRMNHFAIVRLSKFSSQSSSQGF